MAELLRAGSFTLGAGSSTTIDLNVKKYAQINLLFIMNQSGTFKISFVAAGQVIDVETISYTANTLINKTYNVCGEFLRIYIYNANTAATANYKLFVFAT